MSRDRLIPEDLLAERLAAAEERIVALEAELARERERSTLAQSRLTTKEREVLDIHRSRAWSTVRLLRSLKYRWLDPLLGAAGVVWPPRKAAPTVDTPAPVVPARTREYDVVCFSTCDWDSRRQRPQQLMLRFAEAGYRVFYISQQFRDTGPPAAIVAKGGNVFEVTLRGPRLNVYAHALSDSARQELGSGVDFLRREVSLGTAAMFLHLPFWWPLASQVRERFGWPVLYDCMDLHEGFATVRQAMVAQEEELLSRADVVIASSTVLEERALRRREEVLLLRNGCDFEHFAATVRVPPRTDTPRPVVGYYGAISDWFDSALVAELAERRPDWDFVLVGSTYNGDVARLARLSNVSLPGEEPYETLPQWLGRFDVAIIPFRRTPLTEATNPVKVYEMLASGVPVVSVPIPEVAMLAPLVRLASNATEFEAEIEAALALDAGSAEERRAFAQGQTWRDRFEILEAATTAAVSRSV